ncbi:LacI family transcriptional regulator [Rubritalea squalenifaciens DSM 18772]|uniref:LacI family transcriptional regulator n=1 Tax=Rubritalea squalenifaciens DSM 18772 TaxID=1123071 RepID=A0A1M6E5M8_9BACT|nr:helix-turn-helix domain-containing protein [Rubritalea squalenifaciens]SHI80578.1 LacI family transcriptional regulator [Rubritalea squalenifaciens DSM 18772]
MDEKKRIAIIFENSYERPFKLINGILSLPGLRDKCAFRSFPLYQVQKDDVFTDEWQPDGILTMVSEEDNDPNGWIQHLDVPVVNLIHTRHHLHPSIAADYSSIVDAAMDHFGAIECEEILYAGTKGGPLLGLIDKLFRTRAEKKGIRYHMLEFPEQLDASDAADLESIVPGLRELLENATGKIGIYSTHDRRGRVINDYVIKQGYSVPNQVAILGCFDSVDAKLCDPPLSSIMLQDKEQGSTAMEMLYRLITGQELEERNAVMPVLGVRVRGSTVGDEANDIEVLRARNLIRERAAEGVTVDQIVDELNVSRSTFEKRFSALTGRSPAQEIRKVRLELAKEHLLTTDLPLTQIAPKVGFMDRRAFMVFFKREAGMTPGAFRDAHR